MKNQKTNLIASYTSSPQEDFHKPVTLPQDHIACLHQNWLPQLEKNFQPTQAWVKWNEQSIYIYAVLHDKDIFNPCAQLNEFSYKQGDTFEVFLRPDKADSYIEVHLTPSNIVTQLKFKKNSEIQKIRSSSDPEKLLRSHLFDTPRLETAVAIESNRWRVFLAVPFTLFGNISSKNSLWHFSFCRYDYAKNTSSPILSSSSEFTKLDFHRINEWNTLILSK